MKKSLVLAMAMALGVTASAYAANPFSDVPAGHWAYDSINKLAAAGIVDGYGDSTFGGDRLMTRYEMAQIVAKAMAKGANVDRLAAEFADELDSLGVRVAALEKKSDNVKITGQIRAHYESFDKGNGSGKTAYNATSVLRSRLWITGQINEDWKYTGMLNNEQNLLNDRGDEDTNFQRAFVTGRIGGVKVEAGRNNTVLGGGIGYINSHRTDAIKLGFGKDLKVGFQYGKVATSKSEDVASVAGKYLAATLGGEIGNLGLNGGYIKVDDVNKLDNQDDNIWYVGADYKFGDVKLDATYLKSNVDEVKTNKISDDGFVVGLTYKGAKAAKAGTYGVYTKYYDQAAGTYLWHGMNTELANKYFKTTGFKGFMIGANYAVAKNIVAAVEYSDFKAKDNGSSLANGDKNKTIWSEVIFTF
ncbi:porin [uncultured Phascolarctobacterium sp.]|uniref:porin n=1 Tax=uncultured Phascolarctobacterium sp. TaxID=512296 RepID=UPI0027D96D49|nr:porin [uncultured Phascolarctobacterium sp.]